MNRFLAILTLVGILFLAFFGGILVGEYNTKPFYGMLEWAFHLADKVYDRPLGKELLVSSGLWKSARYDQEGVVRKNKRKLYGDYTLVSPADAQEAELLDLEGNVVHRWNLPFRTIWDESSNDLEPADAALIFWRSLHLYSNGDLLASYSVAGDPRGYGLVKMDAHSNVIWTFDERAEGTFVVREDGTICTVVGSIRTTPVDKMPQLVCPLIQDELVTLSAQGEVLSRINLLDAMVAQVDERILMRLSPAAIGVLGCNSLGVAGKALAQKIGAVEEDDLLVSMRQAGLLVVVDPDNGNIHWLTNGPWVRQGCAKVTKKGNIAVFDADGQRGRGGKSAFMVFDPLVRKLERIYDGSPGPYLESRTWADIQILPNDNVLITESGAGRVFELTPENQVVWEWINPCRAGKDDSYIACVWSAKRYTKEQLDFDFNKGRM